MPRVGRTLVGMFAELGSVPVALFTNSATALLQQIAQCGSFAAACAAANLPGGATIPVACIMGAMGLAAAANAINNRREARKAADEFKAMAGQVTTIEQAVASLQSVLQRHGLAPTPLSPAELSSLAATLQNQDVTSVDDGVAQRMMLALDAAGLATAEHLREVEGHVKDTWLKTLHIWEAQHAHTKWVQEADARLHAALARIETHTALLPGMKALLDTIIARLAAIQSGALSATTLKTKGNLAAAKVAPNRFFTGRVDELARLHAALASGSVAIVHTLAGEGGIGKTELAKAYALIFAAEYDGVWWIDASANALSTELAKVYRLATGSDAPHDVGVPELCQALADLWKNQTHLVVLDNVDYPENFTLFGGMATGRVLATTRELEKTLAGVTPFRVEVLPTRDAVELLRKEIAAYRADVSDADLTAIAEELGGHALAVALAGAYLANYADVPRAGRRTGGGLPRQLRRCPRAGRPRQAQRERRRRH